MCNTDIRTAAKNAGIFLYQIASAMGISEPTMTRKLRFELSNDEKQTIFDVINHIHAKSDENKETIK